MNILFVCTGNICRSPTGEAVLRRMTDAAGLGDAVTIDSSGTHAYHIGQPPDARVLEALALTIALGNDVGLANVHGQTPLHGAVYRGLAPAITLLVDHDAPLDAVDGVGRTPLKLAEEGFFQLASRLRRDASAALLAELGNDTPEQARLRRLNPTPR